MAQNFVACDREQELLLPPIVREWLPEDHLAWFVLAVVEEMDLAAFYAAYRDDGHGRAAHDPAMMVALLLYAYARGERSSRGIERACVEDVAYRVIAANQRPDHATIARFRQRHEAALAGLFGEVLALCAEAGLVQVRGGRGRRHEGPRQRLPAREPRLRADRARDPRGGGRGRSPRGRALGERRGDELPPELATAQGRRGWLREAKRRLDEQRAQEARPIPRSRPERLREAKRRLEEELATECRANAAYEAYRARGVMSDGRRFGAPPKPYTAARAPGREDQPHRPRLAQRQDAARLGAGLQRPGRRQRAADRDRRRGQRSTRPTSGTSSRCSTPPGRARGGRRHRDARGRLADAGYWHQRADGARRRPRHPGADPARRRQAQGQPAPAGTAALRLHAPRPRHRPRRRALPQTPRR